jgi:hypothetical protein
MVQFLQFPWRALLLPGLFLPLLAVPAFERLRPSARVGAAAMLVLANLAHTAPKGFLTFDDEYFAPSSIAQKGINTTTFEEYEPRWVATRPPYTPERLTSRAGNLDVIEIALQSAHQEFAVRADTDALVEASTFYYPGWTARVGGREVPVEPVPGRGTMLFRVPAGAHHITLDLRLTPLRRRAAWLSMATAAALALALVAGRFRILSWIPPVWEGGSRIRSRASTCA